MFDVLHRVHLFEYIYDSKLFSSIFPILFLLNNETIEWIKLRVLGIKIRIDENLNTYSIRSKYV